MASRVSCARCGRIASRVGQKFCSECGAPLSVQVQKEPRCSCGATLRPGAGFCSSCGLQITAAKAGATASASIDSARQASTAEQDRSQQARDEFRGAAQAFGRSLGGAVSPLVQKAAAVARGNGSTANNTANSQTAAYVFLGAMVLAMVLPWVTAPVPFMGQVSVSYLTAFLQALIHIGEVMELLGDAPGDFFLVMLFLAVPALCLVLAIQGALNKRGHAASMLIAGITGVVFSVIVYVSVSRLAAGGFAYGSLLTELFGIGFWLFAFTCIGGIIASLTAFSGNRTDGVG